MQPEKIAKVKIRSALVKNETLSGGTYVVPSQKLQSTINCLTS